MSEAVQLKTRTFQGEEEGPHFVITGGVHGDECEPVFAIHALTELFAAKQERGELGLRGRVTLVPCVNEAAFWRGARTAEDGLDLARTCPGKPDGSITERTAHALSELIRQADYYIDLHTGGTIYDIFPLAGYCIHKDPAILETQRRMAMAFNLPLVWGTTPNLNGRSLSVARDANVPAIYCEYGGRWNGQRQDATSAYFEGCLNVMAAMGMIDHAFDSGQVRHVVEDPRDSSGHLQVQHPAPIDGLFVPLAYLGDLIEKNAVFGEIVNPFTGQREVVRSLQTGVVLLLRAMPTVKKGDALLAVAENP